VSDAILATGAISGSPGLGPLAKVSNAPSSQEPFGSVLGRMLTEVDSLQKRADQAVEGLATGKVKDVHDVMLAMNEADLSFRLMLEVRNKLVEAYQEVSRMQV
jgi:flagellar hook-basal body complex protein FliE